MHAKVQEFIQNDQLTEAFSLCEKLLSQDSKDHMTWHLLADIHSRTGKPADAENCLLKAIGLNSRYAPSHTSLAMLYHGRGDLSRAEQQYKLSLKYESKQPTVAFNLALTLQAQNKLEQAERLYRKAIKLNPGYVKALANLGYLLRQSGKVCDAIECYSRALELAPQIGEINFNLGISYLGLGEFEAAEKHLSKATAQQPANIDALYSLGIASAALKQHERALACHRKILSLSPNNVQALIASGFVHLSQGQLDKAKHKGETAINHDPDNENARCLMASCSEKSGDYETAYEHLSPLLDSTPLRNEAVLCFASISTHLDMTDAAIDLMERYLIEAGQSQIDTDKVHFKLGKAYNNKHEYEKAFMHYYTANKMRNAQFDADRYTCEIDELIAAFPADSSDIMNTSSVTSDCPIFIVGMPRSGTTLVEQILDSHFDVTGVGELNDIHTIAHDLKANTDTGYPSCLSAIDSHKLTASAERYLNKNTPIDSITRHIVDKMPNNFLHLGLIQLLFPNARIIHCRRHAMDNCLSCYITEFSVYHPWKYDLKDIGHYYLGYNRLMQHWKNVLTLPILEVQYETMVAEQETMTRKLLEFCELPWDDACLQFHTNKRFAWTASYDQVRQPMYKDAIQRWKHYEPHLQELKNIINPVID